MMTDLVLNNLMDKLFRSYLSEQVLCIIETYLAIILRRPRHLHRQK